MEGKKRQRRDLWQDGVTDIEKLVWGREMLNIEEAFWMDRCHFVLLTIQIDNKAVDLHAAGPSFPFFLCFLYK